MRCAPGELERRGPVVTSTPATNIYALLVAVSRYEEAGKDITRNVPAAVPDAELLAEALEHGFGVPRDNIRLLLDEAATIDGIRDGIKELREDVPDDEAYELWVYLGGHGIGAGDENSGKTVFATWDTTLADPTLTGLTGGTLYGWLPKANRTLILLDCCHAGGVDDDGGSPRFRPLDPDIFPGGARVVIAACTEEQRAYDLRDGSQGIFATSLLEVLHARDKETPVQDLFEPLRKRVEQLARKERDAPQTPKFSMGQQGEPWTLPPMLEEWLPPSFGYLPSFERREPPVELADRAGHDGYHELQCLVVLSDADATLAPLMKLQSVVGDALRAYGARIKQVAKQELASEPLVIHARDAVQSRAHLSRTIRALCSVPIAIFDATKLEPAVLLLLGIRSVVRRGVTLCSVGDEADDPTLPFNLREVNYCTHAGTPGPDGREPYEVLGLRIANGLKELETVDGYMDLPGYDAVRRPDASRIVVPKDGVLVLCPFGGDYAENSWPHVRTSLNVELQSWHSTEGAETKPRLFRMVEARSPRLLTQTLYERIRSTSLCVVDLSGWRANVLLELGIRLASCPVAPVCLLDDAEAAAEGKPLYEQKRDIARIVDPLRYRLNDGGFESLKGLRDRYASARDRRSPLFEEAERWIAVDAEVPAPMPAEALARAANRLEPEIPERSGDPVLLYPENTRLRDRASEAALEWRLAAWLYLDGRYTADELRRDGRKPAALRLRYERLGSWLQVALQNDPAMRRIVERVERSLGDLKGGENRNDG